MRKHLFLTAMLIDIASPQALGLLVRATRKRQKIRMDDLAGSAGVGPVFVRDVERGKQTVQFGRVFRILEELGIQLKVDVTEDVIPDFAVLKLKGVKPIKRRRPSGLDGTNVSGRSTQESTDKTSARRSAVVEGEGKE